MSEKQGATSAQMSPIPQHVAMLNLRINDMMTQLNTVMKAILDENNALKQENAELRAKPQTASQSTNKQ